MWRSTAKATLLLHVRTIGSEGAGAGQFLNPSGVAFDAAGHIVDVEYDNHRVQVLRYSNGAHVRTIGSQGSVKGQFYNPCGGIAIDSDGRIVVADTCPCCCTCCQSTRIVLQGERKRWVASDDVPSICHPVLTAKDITAPNKRTEFKMPGLEPSAEEQAAAAADTQAAASAEAQRADEELQAIEIDDAGIQKRATAATERELRAKDRAALQNNRMMEARRAAAASQLQKLLPLLIARVRERRALRVCIAYDTPWVATLQQLKPPSVPPLLPLPPPPPMLKTPPHAMLPTPKSATLPCGC